MSFIPGIKNLPIATGTQFSANIAIVNPSPATKEMQSDLPDNYTRSQNSGVFSLLYGTGYEQERLKQSLKQLEANNYLYSPDVQNETITIDGKGKYLIEFAVPFVTPPLNVNVVASNYTDVFIEFTSRFGMIINVGTDQADVVEWRAYGFVGAATDKFLGDSLYQNFGSQFNFTRQGDSEIDDSSILAYEKISTFINVEQIIPVYNFSYVTFTDGTTLNLSGPTITQSVTAVAQGFQIPTTLNQPPTGTPYVTGFIRATTVLTTPPCTHEFVDVNGGLLALLDCSTIGPSVTSYYSSQGNARFPLQIRNSIPNLTANKVQQVYITGFSSTYDFDPYRQPAFLQEIFRADNKYRRLLAGINLSLLEGPSQKGLANIVETLFSQPYIPHDIWNESDYRIFKDSVNSDVSSGSNTVYLKNPKFQTTQGYASQYETYPAAPPVVEILRVKKPWNPDTISFNNQPSFEAADNIQSDGKGIEQTVVALNTSTQFDMTAEIVRQLRLGIKASKGGVVDWNYARVYSDLSATYVPFLPYEGNATNKSYPYFFLNLASDSYAGISIFYYAINLDFNKKPVGYAPAYGPLKINQDYFIEPLGELVADAQNPGSFGYDIPSEMLQNFAADSNVPFVTPVTPNGLNIITGLDGKHYWKGTHGSSNLKQPPQFYIRLKLSRYNMIHNGLNADFPTSANDFIIYSYEPVTVSGTRINGNFGIGLDLAGNRLVQYYDADSKITNPPSDTPFVNGGEFRPTALAQTSFAKFVSATSYNYICTMVGGTVEFSKTINVSNLIQRTAVNDTLTSSPVFFNMLGLSLDRQADYYRLAPNTEKPVFHRQGASEFVIEGIFTRVRDISNGLPTLRVQLEYGKYCLVDHNGSILAIIQDSSPAYAQYGTVENVENVNLIGQTMVLAGPVYKTIWDTRMPVNTYLTDSPIFQVTANFDNPVVAFTPDQTSFPTPANNNYLVIIDGIPGGVQENIRAFWNFNITRTPILGETVAGILGFSDIYLQNGTVQRGIMSLFCGVGSNVSQYVQSGTKVIPVLNGDTVISYSQVVSATYIDLDAAYYVQAYTSPNVTGYFLNYKDYVKELTVVGSGSSLQTTGDKSLTDTLTYNFSKQTFSAAQYANYNTTLNFFSSQFGFISLSVLPNMFFNNATSGTPIDIIRPNNNGLAIRIKGNSHAGLVFYGKNQSKVVDKPTRLIVNYSYAIASQPSYSKIVEIEDGGYANWVNASEPDTTFQADTFYIAGNEFKYAHRSYDQATNELGAYQYADSIQTNNPIVPNSVNVGSGNAPFDYLKDSNGNYINPPSLGSNYYSVTPQTAIPPVFEVDPDPLISTSLKRPIANGQPGPPFRYRKPAPYFPPQDDVKAVATTYTNISPEKIAYIQFDLSAFPFDTVINKAILEIYFASGFTIKQGKDVNFTLNDNISWEKSRLSGNGLTYQDKNNALRPLNNVHWRKNYFEIIVPYAFVSEPQDFNYGIRSLFGQSQGLVPSPVTPQPNLEYLGFVNIDEIDPTKLYSRSFLTEQTVGLANIILTKSSIIYVVNGILTFNKKTGLPLLGLDNVQNVAIQYLNHTPDPNSSYLDASGNKISPLITRQQDVLPNQKVLLFPYGLQSDFFLYGYVKSILASSYIGFTPTDISIYQQALGYVTPIYTQYNVKLLEADTYFPYTTFGRDTTVAGTTQDISF